MAVVAWLMNLDFAGGDGAGPVAAGGGVLASKVSQRRRYGYGYRYIQKGAVWITSLTPFL